MGVLPRKTVCTFATTISGGLVLIGDTSERVGTTQATFDVILLLLEESAYQNVGVFPDPPPSAAGGQ